MSKATGVQLEEACNINTSLMTLGRVIRGITSGDASVPYRECSLTWLLQASAGKHKSRHSVLPHADRVLPCCWSGNQHVGCQRAVP